MLLISSKKSFFSSKATMSFHKLSSSYFLITLHLVLYPCFGLTTNLNNEMLCEKFNETMCSSSSNGEGCNGTDECKPAESEKGNLCYSLWQNTGNSFTIKLKELFLRSRFEKAVTIQGTQQYHAFLPKSTSQILVTNFSEVSQCWEKEVSTDQEKLKLEDISGYVTAVYAGNWWLGYVLEKNELDEVKITFRHPFGPAASFSYPRNADVLWVSVVDILAKVNPVTPTRRSYVLLQSDVFQTNVAFSNYN